MAQPVEAVPQVEQLSVGLHLIGDLYECQGEDRYFFDADFLRDFCVEQVQTAGLTVVGNYFHQFGEDGGVTGVVVLAESHLSIHTWPEKRYVTLDVYVCNYTSDNRAKARRLFNSLVATYQPGNPKFHCVERE
ncbi:MAG: adenosylmethionine decarboxylase [Alphaproteobacteria bacterium CG_4_10_14_0_2_um_filter_63_37]|nr:MAG: S-adenosylmethionine decarboxylase proenzyme [Proteobacteria bacterium CG1_02_64_396]PJA23458.1 MAG: adenosylmethionine decarboxylase [Alphaproteobacteria bacterium CG_4_10_14_0_2_um_filter_63_37]